MEKFKAKIKIACREILNFLTNVLVPILSLACAFAEAAQLPVKAIDALKKAEYWAFYASGTAEKIKGILDVPDEVKKDADVSD